MNESDPELLTVAAAAQALGISERRLRRLLARPEHAARTRQISHETRTGTRTAAALPPNLIADLRELLACEANAAANADRKPAETRLEASEGGAQYPADPAQATPLVAALLAEREARIADQAREIERLARLLDEANERERLTLEALAREQSLRLLLPTPEQPQEAPGGAQEGSQRPRRWRWPWQRKAGQ